MISPPRIATFSSRGKVVVECREGHAPVRLILDGTGRADGFAEYAPAFAGARAVAAVVAGQPAWMWPWQAAVTEFIPPAPPETLLARLASAEPQTLVIVAPGALVTAASLAGLPPGVRPVLLVSTPPGATILKALAAKSGAYLIAGSGPVQLTIRARPDVTIDVPQSARDIILPFSEVVMPMAAFLEDHLFDAELVSPCGPFVCHAMHEMHTSRSPAPTDEQLAALLMPPVPECAPRADLDPRDGTVEGDIVFTINGTVTRRPLHRITQLTGDKLELAIVVKNAKTVIIAATRGNIIAGTGRVVHGSPVTIAQGQTFRIEGIATHVEIRAFHPSTRPPITREGNADVIRGALEIGGTPVDFYCRDGRRYELWARGQSLHVRGSVTRSGDKHHHVDTFENQASLDLSWLWHLACRDTIRGNDKSPLKLDNTTSGAVYNTSVYSRTEVQLTFDIRAGTLEIVGSYYVSID